MSGDRQDYVLNCPESFKWAQSPERKTIMNIIDHNRTYTGVIVGFKNSERKADRTGKPFITNPVAFICPLDKSLQLTMIAYRDRAGITCENPENISAVIPLPGQGERRWTKGNSVLTEADYGKNVSFTVTDPDKRGLPQAINVRIINPEETLDEDLCQEAAEEARLELAELTQTAPVAVAPVAVTTQDVAAQNGAAAMAQEIPIEEAIEDPLSRENDNSGYEEAYGDYGKPSRQRKLKRLNKKSHRREWDE